jgi:hypothetical protein
MTHNARKETTCPFATIGSLEERGGRITTTTGGLTIAGLAKSE